MPNLRSRLILLACLFVGLIDVPHAHAFTVQSGFSSGCHERISVASFLIGGAGIELLPDELVPDGEWEEILDHLYPDASGFSRAQRFFLFSIITGARAPDSEGFSLTNLAVLRSVQSDPAGQYIHCLRAAEDDYEEGNDSALEGCRNVIRDEVGRAFDAFNGDVFELIEVQMTLENYGTIEVDVSPIGYHFGRALHTLQDSFTHTIRAPDMRSVVHTMNYEAAIADTLDEARDGMPHSAAADSCVTVGGVTGELVNRERVFAAIEAGADLVRAFNRGGQRNMAGEELALEVDAVLLKWFRRSNPETLGYEVCDMSNDYCSSPWLETARLSPAGPVLSCTTTANRSRIPVSLSVLAFVLLLRLAPRTLRLRGAR
ncbi:MAG: hypothetical protein ACI9KE_002922 [Polyangiales bacterium]|jgi:hypothetical protein